MKKHVGILCIIITISPMILGACSQAETATVSSVEDLALAPRLVVGILSLEDTDLAVTSVQAVDLLTYWQAYQALSAEETAAQVELDGLVQQIQGVLTGDQLQSIEALQLTSQSVSDMTQALAGDLEIITEDTQDTASNGQRFTGMPGGPGGPGGGMPSDETSILMGQGADMGAGNTSETAPQTVSGAQSGRINPILLQALIALMEEKVLAGS